MNSGDMKVGNSIYNGEDCMLTTVDNPYDPYKQFDSWYAFDTSLRIIPQVDPDCPVSTHCSEYLARIAITSNDMSAEEYRREVSQAIDEIIRLDPFHIYKKVYPNDEET